MKKDIFEKSGILTLFLCIIGMYSLYLNDSNIFRAFIDIAILVYSGYQWFVYFAEFEPEYAFPKLIFPSILTYLAFCGTRMDHTQIGIILGISFIVNLSSLLFILIDRKKEINSVGTSASIYNSMSLEDKIKHEIEKDLSRNSIDFNRKMKLTISYLEDRKESSNLYDQYNKSRVLIKNLYSLLIQLNNNLENIKEDIIYSQAKSNLNKLKILVSEEIEKYNKIKIEFLESIDNEEENLQSLIKAVV